MFMAFPKIAQTIIKPREIPMRDQRIGLHGESMFESERGALRLIQSRQHRSQLKMCRREKVLQPDSPQRKFNRFIEFILAQQRSARREYA